MLPNKFSSDNSFSFFELEKIFLIKELDFSTIDLLSFGNSIPTDLEPGTYFQVYIKA